MRGWRSELGAAGLLAALAACRPRPAEPTPTSSAAPLFAGGSSLAPRTVPDAMPYRGSADADPSGPRFPLADVSPASPEPSFEGRCVRLTPAQAPPPVPTRSANECPSDPEPGGSKQPIVRVGFRELSGVAVDAELVRTQRDMARGLMYRRSLGETRGMLFDLGVREDHKFWMHNTCIPLDLIFIDFDGLVVGIVENAPTLDDETRGVGCASRWVLEVNAGWSRRHGLRAGQRAALPEVEAHTETPRP